MVAPERNMKHFIGERLKCVMCYHAKIYHRGQTCAENGELVFGTFMDD